MKETIRTLLIILLAGIPFFAQATPPDTIKTAIHINADKVFCIDTSEFAGTMVSFDDICSMGSGTAVNFVMLDFCVSYGGLELGTESACLVYCDDTGNCDTTIYIVTTVPDTVTILPPIAVDDYTNTFENEAVTIDLLANDILTNNGAYQSLKLIQQGNHGTGFIDINGQLTYAPGQDFCGASDTLVYELCNITACDEAMVVITVAACLDVEGLFVYDGFSPNGDGVNEKWKIYGLDEFPDHKIYVYNRWGNIVFETNNYQNDWAGTWDATPLPPGTYFYLIDDGKGKRYRGYLQIGY